MYCLNMSLKSLSLSIRVITNFTLEGLLSFMNSLNMFIKASFFSSCKSTKFTLKGLLSFMYYLNMSIKYILLKICTITKFTLKGFCSFMDIIYVFGQFYFPCEYFLANCTLFYTSVWFWNIKNNTYYLITEIASLCIVKIKVSKFQKQIFLLSLEPENKRNYNNQRTMLQSKHWNSMIGIYLWSQMV